MASASPVPFELTGKRVFVAGHAGMAGSAIVRRLRQEDCQVLAAPRRELDLTRQDLPSIGVSGDIRVRPEQRKAFLDELQQTLQDLFTRYGGAEGDAFRLAVACYPKGDPR